MHFLRAHFAYSVLVLAGGLCLAACSKDERTALEVDVSLSSGVAQQPDAVRFVVKAGGTTFVDRQANWSDASAGTLKVTLLLPAEAAGSDTLEVHALLNGNEIAAASEPVNISAGKATGPISVILQPVVITVDGGADALPSDGPEPDLAAGPEVGKPDAGVTPDTSIDQPGPEAAAPDAPPPSDGVQPVEVEPSSDAPQLSDVADAGAGGDSFAELAWQPVENVQYDPQDPVGSSGYPGAIAVAVDPVNQHVYVMWADNSAWAVRVRRWNHTTATWEKTQTLEDNGPGSPINPQIGVDGAGHVIAAWHHDFISTTPTSTKNQMGGVWVSRSTDGNSWLAAESVTPQRPRYVAELSLAVARNGEARIAFSEIPTEVGPYVPLLYSAYFDGTTWTTGQDPLALEASDDTNSRYPSVAIGDDGSGIIVFTQKDSSNYYSVAASTFAGANVADYIILDNNTTYDLSDMAVAVNRNGEGAVVWGDSSGAMLRSYSPSTGTWTAAQNIGNVGLYQPRAVMAQDGTVTVAWSQLKAGHYNVWAMEGTAGGTWTTPMALETDNLSIKDDPYASTFTEMLPYPSLAVDGTGNVLLLWSKKTKDTPTHEFAVEVRRKLAGLPNNWQPTTELARKSILLPSWLSLAVSDDGLGAASYYWENPDTTSHPDAHQVFVSLLRYANATEARAPDGGPSDAGAPEAKVDGSAADVMVMDATVDSTTPNLDAGPAQCGRIKCDCTFNGVKLWGNVQYVTNFPDFTIKVSSFPDLNVYETNFPSSCGEWHTVTAFPDFTVQIVDMFEDFDIAYSPFPGIP